MTSSAIVLSRVYSVSVIIIGLILSVDRVHGRRQVCTSLKNLGSGPRISSRMFFPRSDVGFDGVPATAADNGRPVALCRSHRPGRSGYAPGRTGCCR